jgi:hypothetical protein
MAARWWVDGGALNERRRLAYGSPPPRWWVDGGAMAGRWRRDGGSMAVH